MWIIEVFFVLLNCIDVHVLICLYEVALYLSAFNKLSSEAASASQTCQNLISCWRREMMNCSVKLSTMQTIHSTSSFQRSLWRPSFTTSEIVHTIVNYRLIKDICLTVILLHECCINTYTESSHMYIVYIILFTVYCNFICVLSDAVIKHMIWHMILAAYSFWNTTCF